MKSLFIALSLISSLVQASPATDRITIAAEMLQDLASNADTYQVAPQTDAKAMMFELFEKEGYGGAEDFAERWSEDPWEVDSASWGTDDIAGAQNYIEGALQRAWEESDQTEADKIALAQGMRKTIEAFKILKSIPSVKFGAAPLGAVQCGISFPSLLIIDTESGTIHNVGIEESGGC